MYRFANFELDVRGRDLRSAGESLHLEPQAFDLLSYLVEHRDRVVDKIELLDRVWGHSFLSDANLTTRVKEIRRALGDDGRRQHTIRNVRGRGYQFVAPIADGETAGSGRLLPAARLFGRDADLVVVLTALTQSRLVTLTGAGGIGKSTLAIAAAAARDGTCPDGIHLIELATVGSGDHALAAVARALDIVADGDRPEDAVRSIARLGALLILDNCEHVIDDVSLLVDRLLNTVGARVRVLAMSQVRLGLSDEIVIAVAPLTVDQASRLFRARTRRCSVVGSRSRRRRPGRATDLVARSVAADHRDGRRTNRLDDLRRSRSRDREAAAAAPDVASDARESPPLARVAGDVVGRAAGPARPRSLHAVRRLRRTRDRRGRRRSSRSRRAGVGGPRSCPARRAVPAQRRPRPNRDVLLDVHHRPDGCRALARRVGVRRPGPTPARRVRGRRSARHRRSTPDAGRSRGAVPTRRTGWRNARRAPMGSAQRSAAGVGDEWVAVPRRVLDPLARTRRLEP